MTDLFSFFETLELEEGDLTKTGQDSYVYSATDKKYQRVLNERRAEIVFQRSLENGVPRMETVVY